jgi:LacI family transcriptional regulator
MSKPVTIKDIARICGVGVSTVSRAINDDPAIKAETKEKILAAVKEYHYVPNISARNLQATETNTIGLMVRGVGNVFFQEMYHLFQTELEKNGYSYAIHDVNEDDEVLMEAMQLERERRLKGIIFLGGRLTARHESLTDLNVPFVLCTVAHQDADSIADYNAVAIDDAKEGYRATNYLIEKGHKSIAIIAGKEHDREVGRNRLNGYFRALKDHGIERDQDLVAYMRSDIPEFTAENGYLTMKNLLSRGKKFTAVVCISDMVAFGAYKAIYEAGLKIPDDISVIGFDGIDLGRFMYPALTTVAQPANDLVSATTDLLFRNIEKAREPEQIICGATLKERESVRVIK